MNEITIWVSFDLGLQGDYQGLYSWLDKYGAKECGDSIAVLKYKVSNDLLAEIKGEIKACMNLVQSDRIYIIWKEDDGNTKGRFINGGRKRAPWQGFGQSYQSQSEDY